MDREHVRDSQGYQGRYQVSGDKGMEHEGNLDKAKGATHNAAGIKDAARDAADAATK